MVSLFWIGLSIALQIAHLNHLITKNRTIRNLKIHLVKSKKTKGNLKMTSHSNNQPNNSKTLVIRAKVYLLSATQTVIKSKISNKVKKKVTLRMQAARP